MNEASHARAKVRLAPVILAAFVALAGLKAAGLWIGFAEAGAQAAPEPAPSENGDAPSAAPTNGASERLIEHLAARNAELEARERELDTREKVLMAAELRLQASIKSIEEEKKALLAVEDNRNRERRDEIGALSSAYERMKARDAAAIFEVLDEDILLPVAAGMRTQSLAGVLAEMAPEKAKALTVALANRGAETPPAPATASAIVPAPARAPATAPALITAPGPAPLP